MYHTLLTATLAIIMLGAAAGLFFRGSKGLGILMAAAVIANHLGLQYIIQSPEVPGFDPDLSLEYRIVGYVVDASILIQCLITALVFWRFQKGKKPASAGQP